MIFNIFNGFTGTRKLEEYEATNNIIKWQDQLKRTICTCIMGSGICP